MPKLKLSSLLFACLASLSVAVSAAEPVKPKAQPIVSEQQAAQASTVNINTADAETLQGELNGIGKVKAEAIIEHRTANGPFASVDELLEVKGIGAATLEKNRDRLSVN
ncbi:helix-hairpin-helix domain-containing protein [Pseudomonas sp. PDM14]|uniref:ComEA family DNA-binding protein n=1 Tax=Pseudomonas sp. PDM14 TaxID=2769288 RepID=UPI00178359ED|nr:ComEA family DNA-binding protein [Pseudomonas sp. PDM14]MBD9484610.1 helix-hairpin-helix domain-containing protein [Pseudomonas sp. PDM14]